MRLRNIMSGPKKRPPVLFLAAVFAVCIFCGNLVSCNVAEAEQEAPDSSVQPEPLPQPEPDVSSDAEPDQSQTTVLDYAPDLNRNGIPETIRLAELEGGQRLEVLENETVVYSQEGYYAHVGYTAIFLCTADGKDCLLRYGPTMYQGVCDYGYELFTLENGQTMVRQDSVAFDINFGQPMHQDFDPEAIAAFVEEINGLLSHSVQLLNTDQDLLETFEQEGRLVDTLWWLDTWEPVFVRDPDKSLAENLTDFQTAMVREAGGSRTDNA